VSQIDDHDELLEIADRLRRERPQATELELDRIKLRALRGAARESPGFATRQRERLMKSRLALTTMLVIGAMFAFSGVAVAIDGFDSAAEVQYGVDDRVVTIEEVQEPGVQVERQVVAVEGDGGLPVTGFAAIPLIAIGAGLLVAGTLLRRRLPKS
jgi:hypothetical protein